MPVWPGKILFSGQRTARKGYECELCGRPIWPGETYWCRVYLDKEQNTVIVDRQCCKPLK